jgi:3-oxoacyl-[acyl-carrier protein] reductase
MKSDLKGKTVMITGAFGGIGTACVLDFARGGADVILVDVNIPPESRLVEQAESFGVKTAVFKADVSSRSQMEETAGAAAERFGRIDILVNNAGVNVPKHKRRYVHEFFDDEWDRIIAVDLDGVYNCSKPIIRMMAENRYGRIINISAVVGIVPLRNQHAFAAAKAGVIQMTRAWAVELAEYNVTVNAVAPGSVLVEGTRELFYSDKEAAEAMLSHIPMGRAGVPEDISHAVLFFADDASSYITGTVLTVDGGWTCGFARNF